MKSLEAVVDYFLTGNIQKQTDSFFYSADRGQSSSRLMPLLKFAQGQNFLSDNVSLLVSSVGELTNNCFDHNLGYWTDKPGCALGFCCENRLITVSVADRGRGIAESLKDVVSKNQGNEKTLVMAFENIITGRAPEKRGNGLKYVSKNVRASAQNSLQCFSNDCIYQIGNVRSPAIRQLSSTQSFGTLIFLQWSRE